MYSIHGVVILHSYGNNLSCNNNNNNIPPLNETIYIITLCPEMIINSYLQLVNPDPSKVWRQSVCVNNRVNTPTQSAIYIYMLKGKIHSQMLLKYLNMKLFKFIMYLQIMCFVGKWSSWFYRVIRHIYDIYVKGENTQSNSFIIS